MRKEKKEGKEGRKKRLNSESYLTQNFGQVRNDETSPLYVKQ